MINPERKVASFCTDSSHQNCCWMLKLKIRFEKTQSATTLGPYLESHSTWMRVLGLNLYFLKSALNADLTSLGLL